MIYSIEIYFMLFIIYSFLGWIMECTFGVIEKHKFVNRGFLIGPYCPIYGMGVISVSLLLTRFANNLILIFLLSTVICGMLEYFTSYIMEKIFKARWWDYSNNKFNINGRVCLGTLLPFGAISAFVICVVNPWMLEKLYMIPNNVLNYVVLGILIVFVIDCCISFNIIMRFKNLSKQEKDSTEEISKKVRETAEAAIKKLTGEKESLIRKMNISRLRLAKNVKYTRRKYTNKIKNQRITLVGSFKVQLQGIDETIRGYARDLADRVASKKENQQKLSKAIKEKFVKESKLNKRLISAFPNVEQREYKRKKDRGSK